MLSGGCGNNENAISSTLSSSHVNKLAGLSLTAVVLIGFGFWGIFLRGGRGDWCFLFCFCCITCSLFENCFIASERVYKTKITLF